MCFGVSIAWGELPVGLVEAHRLSHCVYDRGGEREVRFLWRHAPAVLPCWWNGKLRVVRWGTPHRVRGCRLPPGGWTWEATVEAGGWGQSHAEPVDVPATYIWAGGVWTRVRHGCRGLLVKGLDGVPVVYLIVKPSSRYYRVMTRVEFMPVLIGEVI